MERNQETGRPPLRRFLVRTNPIYSQDGTVLIPAEDHQIDAHLIFNNESRGEGYVFRRYYDNDVRTEKVAEFALGAVQFFKEIDNG